jgi:hypothetical protein
MLSDGSIKITVFNTMTTERLIICVRPNGRIALTFTGPLNQAINSYQQMIVFADSQGCLRVEEAAWRDDWGGDLLLEDLDPLLWE